MFEKISKSLQELQNALIFRLMFNRTKMTGMPTESPLARVN